MTNKLTDKDIIKALPNMTYGGHYCAKCKYDNGKGNDRCGLKGCKIARYALDQITRQQSENENLKAENQSLRSAANSLKMHYEEAQAEIERLKNYELVVSVQDTLNTLRSLGDFINNLLEDKEEVNNK